jgi:hypothetical protein
VRPWDRDARWRQHDAFHLLNHLNFALSANILAAPNFGTLFQTPDAAQNNVGLGSGGPRLIQFALELSF